MSQGSTVIEIDARTFAYDKTYPNSLRSIVSEGQWNEFCKGIDECIKASKSYIIFQTIIIAVFVLILIAFFVILPLVLAGAFAVPFSVFSGLVAVGMIVMMIYFIKQPRVLNLNSAIQKFKQSVTNKDLSVDFKANEIKGGPWRLTISTEPQSTAYVESQPPVYANPNVPIELVPLMSDTTPDGTQPSSDPPLYYVA